MKRYLGLWLGLTAVLMALTAAFNVVVDPYGIFRLVDRAGWNAVKPTATTRGGMAKAWGVLREHPHALILGNSRAEVGFDPEHRGFAAAARPVFNLSIAGTGPTTTLSYFRHALAAADASGQSLHDVVWGIDFMDFLVKPDSRPDGQLATDDEHRLARSRDALQGPTALAWRVRDSAESTLTMRALTDSLQTVLAQRDPDPTDQTRLGFNPMRDYRKIARDEGYWAIFHQKDGSYVRTFANKPHSLFDARGTTSAEFDALREILRECRQRGIALHLVIYPYHVHFQQAIRLNGHAERFDTWKRIVVRIVADEARASGGPAVPIWDFSGFNRWTTEPVPPQGDRRSVMQWYWEAGHFKRELGDLVLDQVLGSAPPNPEFGVRLDEANVEQRIAETQAQAARYSAEHPDVIAALQRLAP